MLSAGFQSGVDSGMTFAVGVRNQEARLWLGLLDHVCQVMPVVLGQCGAEDHEVELFLPQRVLHLLAALRLGDIVARFFNRNRL